MFFVYDSYRVSPRDWSTILSPTGHDTVRGTDLDGIFLALWLTRADGAQIETGGFDGGYTYFADPGTSHAARSETLARLIRRGGGAKSPLRPERVPRV